MSAILILIKTLIPFGVAFIFLWGIGRACCTPSKKSNNTILPKQRPQPNTPPQNDIEDDEQSTLFKKKQDFFSHKEEMVKSKKELELGKHSVFDSKQELVSSREELISSKPDLMAGKADLMTSKNMMIREATEDHSEGIDLTLALPRNKKRKLTPIQQSFLLKEILDAPKAVRPYKTRYPR